MLREQSYQRSGKRRPDLGFCYQRGGSSWGIFTMNKKSIQSRLLKRRGGGVTKVRCVKGEREGKEGRPWGAVGQVFLKGVGERPDNGRRGGGGLAALKIRPPQKEVRIWGKAKNPSSYNC